MKFRAPSAAVAVGGLETPAATLTSFAGFTTSSPIKSLSITESPVPVFFDYPTVDNLIVGVAVPEPASLTLTGAAVLCLAAYSRWRKRTRSPRP
jgi:hypothetical protein